MRHALLALTLIACTESPHTTPYACPTAHANPWEACYALLADMFPDTPRDAWNVLECGDLGVLAVDLSGVDTTYAVTTAGDAYVVRDCTWEHVASRYE